MNRKLRQCALCLAAVSALYLIGCEQTDEPKATGIPTIPTTVFGQQEYAYTWEEFENMTAEEQIAFQNSFPDQAAFDAWLQSAQHVTSEMPWDEPGAKQPKDYTWEEFEELTAEQQMAFQNSFGSYEAFDAWLQKNMPQETENTVNIPWENGGKQPKDYTWEEFEALTAEQQMIFQNSFESQEAFDAWLQKNMPQETENTVNIPWENGGKQPKDYTWEEFEALSAEQQMIFQNSFGSFEAFDAWLQKNMPQEMEDTIDIPWENGGKQPEDYTWEEFEALSAELQMIFQNSFDSFEDFDAWLQRVNP